MDSFEWNKIAGAVLFALLLSVGLSIFSDVLFETEAPKSPGYVIAVATEEGAEGGEAVAEQSPPIATLLASADPGAGKSSAKVCGTCHTFGSGEPNKVGPNLWGVVSRPIAAHEGYEYSDAMKSFAEGSGEWTFEHLNAFLHKPKESVPGTKMAFAGVKDDKQRANVIAYLRSLSDNPVPLPEPTAAEAEGGTEVASADATGAAAPPTNTPEAAQPATAEEPGAVVPPKQVESAAPAEQPINKPADGDQAAGEQPAGQPAQEQDQQQADAPATAPAPAELQVTNATGAQEGGNAPAAVAEQQAAEAPATPAPPVAPATTPPPAAEQAGNAPAAEQQVAQAEAPAQPEAPSAAPAAGTGDAAGGEKFAARCKACHSFEKGGPNQVGPHLFGVVGRPVASVPDFEYSDGMKEFSAGGTKIWDQATLDTYLANPRGTVPGTKMAFPGVKKDTDRANLIAYLNTLVE